MEAVIEKLKASYIQGPDEGIGQDTPHTGVGAAARQGGGGADSKTLVENVGTTEG